MNTAVRIANYQRPVDLLEIAQRGKAAPSKSDKAASFKDTFTQEMAGRGSVNFSKHALQRLHSRGIEMSEQRLARLSSAIDKAQAKGSRETLILGDDMALVVSIPNRTVITAFDRDNLREGVVTSIDSAVIL